MDQEQKKFWIVVASKDHVFKAVSGGFIQANHGKKAPMQRLKKGDGIICYSSKLVLGGKEPYQKFTAIGEVTDDEVYSGVMHGGKFHPYRRDVHFYDCQEADIKPLIDTLNFILNKQKWGFPFMRGFFEIEESDYHTIAEQMQIHG